jgi:hypothetical protein
MIRVRVPDKGKGVIFVPEYTVHLPGYFNPETGKIFNLSDQVPEHIVEGGFSASDHSVVVTGFKPVKNI